VNIAAVKSWYEMSILQNNSHDMHQISILIQKRIRTARTTVGWDTKLWRRWWVSSYIFYFIVVLDELYEVGIAETSDL